MENEVDNEDISIAKSVQCEDELEELM